MQRLQIYYRTVALGLAAIFTASGIAQEKTPPGKAAKTDSPPINVPAASARGRIVFLDRCGICHFSDSDAMKVGPGLKGIYKRGKFANGSKVDNASMEKWIVNGGKDMPPFGPVLNPAQIQDLLSYHRTI
jgi:mono/diheme cytochrome c family protein